MSAPPLSFVTAVFESELHLHTLQARSFAVHLAAADVDEIVVLDNTRRGLRESERRALITRFGPHSPRVRVIAREALGQVGAASGWRSQQILKLAVAAEISSPHYVVLDAKNHFVRAPGPEEFVASDGRSRVPAYSFENHPLRPSLTRVLEYFSLDPSRYVTRFTATTTPFVLETEQVRDLVDDVQLRSGHDFAREFLAHDLTEFFLYSAWLISVGRFHAVIEEIEQSAVTVWPGKTAAGEVVQSVASARADQPAIFSVHRDAFPRLDAEGSRAVSKFWVDSGLFPSVPDALAFIDHERRHHARLARAQRVRDLPGRALTLARRAAARIARRS